MKKRIIFLSFIVALTFTSCEDAIDIVQDGELNDEAIFKDVANMRLFMNEVYDRLNTESETVVSSLLTDEVAIAGGLTVNDTQRFFVVSTNGNAAAVWNSHYNLINYANRLIRGSQLFTPPAADLPQYNHMLAEARVLRAFAHFQLMTYFSTDISNNNALGVMLVDFVPTIEQDIPRATNGELYTLIESDLAFAEANLINPTGTNAYKFISTNMINAFRARMYLYKKDYTQALTYANLVINNSGIPLSTCSVSVANFPSTSAAVVSLAGSTTINVSPGTSPANAQQKALWDIDQWGSTLAPVYRRMWVDAVQGECIFAVDRQNNRNNFSSRYNTNGSYLTGGPLYDMGRTLFDEYRTSLGGGAEDFRRWCFVDRSATISTTPATASRTSEQIVIDKYPGKTGSHTSNDLKVFRISEMHFIKAECLARNGSLALAANEIRAVRQARSYTGGTVPTPSYGSLTAALADILYERRKELSYEGHRYIDLKRLGTDAGVLTTNRYFQDAINSSATNPQDISVTDYRFTLPIPQDEINVNPLTQNPGY